MLTAQPAPQLKGAIIVTSEYRTPHSGIHIHDTYLTIDEAVKLIEQLKMAIAEAVDFDEISPNKDKP
jgi:hypothetical protein